MYNKGFRIAAVRLYEYCQSLQTVSKGVSVSSVFRWNANGVESKVRESASYSRKVTAALLATAKAFLDHTPYMTQLEVRHKLSDAFSFVCSYATMFAVKEEVWYYDKSAEAWTSCEVTRVYTDADDGVPYYDVLMLDGSVRQTVFVRLHKKH
jgi:hypothetical protein